MLFAFQVTLASASFAIKDVCALALSATFTAAIAPVEVVILRTILVRTLASTSLPVNDKPLWTAEGFRTCTVTVIVTEKPRFVAFLNPSTLAGARFPVKQFLWRTLVCFFADTLAGVVIPAFTFRAE